MDVLAYKLQHPQSPAEELSQCRKTYKITGSWQEAGGLQKIGSNQPMSVPERNRLVQAIQHEVGVAADMQSLSKFVREQIFYVFVHDFKDDKDDCLSAEGEVCQEFVESYFDTDHHEKILNPCLQNATDEEIRAYLKWLWKEGLKPTTRGRGNIWHDLSNEKSAVYAAISEAFKSKLMQGLLNDVWIFCACG